jgi:hypothetical protein
MYKNNLFSAIAGKNRGLLANDQDKIAILAAITQLESVNPHVQPLNHPKLLGGNWRLIYTSSMELLKIDRIPLCQLGNIYQLVRPELGYIYNIAEVNGSLGLNGLVAVIAEFSPLSNIRIKVKFTRSIVGLQGLIGYQSPDQFVEHIIQEKRLYAADLAIEGNKFNAWLDITYLDEDLRISRGNEGNVFVLSRMSNE